MVLVGRRVLDDISQPEHLSKPDLLRADTFQRATQLEGIHALRLDHDDCGADEIGGVLEVCHHEVLHAFHVDGHAAGQREARVQPEFVARAAER